MAPSLSAFMRHLNPFACMGSDGGSKKAVAEKHAAKKAMSTRPAAQVPANSNAETAGNLQRADAAAAAPVPAASTVGHPKRRKAAKAGDKVKHQGGGGGGGGGVMPWRPLYSYDLDPIANCMYFYGSVGGITC